MARKMAKRQSKAIQADLGLKDGCTALYMRVSTQKQVDEGHGLEAQRSELDAYCEAMGWNVCEDHIYEDKGISGKSDDRPAFQAMMEAAKDGRITRIVAVKLDRIARNLKNLLNTVDELKKYKCALVIKKEQFDTSTAQGMFVLQMLGAVSELERSMIAERMEGGRIENAKAGGYNGSRCPLGYTYAAGKFTVNEDQADTVRSIFDSFVAGDNLLTIAGRLNDSDTPTARGGKWYASTIKTVLDNGAYAGIGQWDGTEATQSVYPAIISKATYEAAHLRLHALRPGKPVESML